MKKRIIGLFLAVLATMVFAAACGKNENEGPNKNALPYVNDFAGSIPDGFIEANLNKTAGTRLDGYTEAVNLSASYSSVDAYYADEGYVVVGNKVGTEMKFGVYSLFEKKLVLSVNYNSVQLMSREFTNSNTSVTQIFAKLVDGNQRQGYFNISENYYPIPIDGYESATLRWAGVYTDSIEICEYKMPIGDAIKTEHNVAVNDEGQVVRSKVVALKVGESVSSATSAPLGQYPALKDYTYKIENDKITGYRKGNQVFEVPSLSIYSPDTNVRTFIANKYMFMQHTATLMPDAAEYSFVKNNTKHKLTTCRVDLTNGNIKYYDNFKYCISSASYMKDKNGNPNYVGAICERISYDKLLDASAVILFDDNLNEVANLSRYRLDGDIRKIADNRYLAGSYIIDQKCNIIADLSNFSNISYCANVGAVSLSKNYYYAYGYDYGLIDTDGKLLIPFEYADAFTFFNGYAKNVHSDGKAYLISKDGAKTKISSAVTDINDTEGYLIEKQSGTKAIINIKNFAGKTLLSWEADSVYSNYSYSVYKNNETYPSGLFIRFTVTTDTGIKDANCFLY